MEPVIYPGDVAIVQKVEKEDIIVGDIIQFWTEEYFIIHRVVAIENDKYITKGDNNNIKDRVPVDFGQVKGKLINQVKYLGKPILVLRNKTNEGHQETVQDEYEIGREENDK